jgi:membrane-associated protease RseP (regulator of RpoE activity)
MEALPWRETPVVRPAPPRPRYLRAALLFLLTFFCATTLGPAMVLWGRTDVTTDLVPFLLPGVIRAVWSHPALLKMGLSFSLPALAILLAHELGHYLTCRRYRLPSTLPYFIPVPLNFGTFGAFIRIRAPIRGKRELFDVGVAGPIAGFVALVPFLLYGVARSEVAPMPPDLGGEALAAGAASLFVPGRCLAIELAARLFHGPLAPGETLVLHPVAWGAWLGLFATALNLIPLGQLDGGHILYAATGRLQRFLALPLWLALAVAGYWWPGWWLWCGLVFLFGLKHPPVADEAAPLDFRRKALALVALALLVLSFMPVPLAIRGVPF